MNHIEKGRRNEEIAARFLLSKGHQILERNWRSGKNEIDIISKSGTLLVITEVKTSLPGAASRPEESVSLKKQRSIIHTAGAYLSQQERMMEVRFDLIFVSAGRNGIELEHIEDAFYPLF